LLQDGPSQEIRIRQAQGLILLGEEFYQLGLATATILDVSITAAVLRIKSEMSNFTLS
jgi:hypothetical protein